MTDPALMKALHFGIRENDKRFSKNKKVKQAVKYSSSEEKKKKTIP